MMDDITLVLLGDHDAVQRVTERGKFMVLDLCGGSGSWSRPFQKTGYDVRLIMPTALMRDSVTFRNAVRFGLVEPKPHPVKFYFER